jgi:hypothetical protein
MQQILHQYDALVEPVLLISAAETITVDKWCEQHPVPVPRPRLIPEGFFVPSYVAEEAPAETYLASLQPQAHYSPPAAKLVPDGFSAFPLYPTLPTPPAFHDVWQPQNLMPPRRKASRWWLGQSLNDATTFVPAPAVDGWMTEPADVVRRLPREQGCQVSTPLPIFTSQFLPPQAEIPVLALPRLAGLFAEQLVDPLLKIDNWLPECDPAPQGRRPIVLEGLEVLPLSDLVPVDHWLIQHPGPVVRRTTPRTDVAVEPFLVVQIDQFSPAFPDFVRTYVRPLGDSEAILDATLLLEPLDWLMQHPEPVIEDPFLAAWTRVPSEVTTQTFIVGLGQLGGTMKVYARLGGRVTINPE